MSAFRPRPNKVKHLVVVQTLDELHKKKMSDLGSNFDKLEYISKTGDLLVNYYDIVAGAYYNSETGDGDTETNLDEISENIVNTCDGDEDGDGDEQIEDRITFNSIDASSELKALNLLSQKNRKAKKPIKKRRAEKNIGGNKTIFQFFSSEPSQIEQSGLKQSSEENKPDNKLTNVNRASLAEKFRTIIDKNYACTKVKNSKIVYCSVHPDVEKTPNSSEGCYTCKICGETEHIIMESETVNHKDTNNEKQKYPYKKINHLKEKLNQFQSKETADVPDTIYDKINAELKKCRIRPEMATPLQIKSILKKNRSTNYYEHLQQIYCKITNSPPVTLSRDLEEQIITMFQYMQDSFQSHCPKYRSNFLSYSYVLNKLFRIKGFERHAKFFGLLKSKEKLREQDSIWAKICKDMGWKFHSSF